MMPRGTTGRRRRGGAAPGGSVSGTASAPAARSAVMGSIATGVTAHGGSWVDERVQAVHAEVDHCDDRGRGEDHRLDHGEVAD